MSSSICSSQQGDSDTRRIICSSQQRTSPKPEDGPKTGTGGWGRLAARRRIQDGPETGDRLPTTAMSSLLRDGPEIGDRLETESARYRIQLKMESQPEMENPGEMESA